MSVNRARVCTEVDASTKLTNICVNVQKDTKEINANLV